MLNLPCKRLSEHLCNAHRASANPHHLNGALETIELVHEKFSDSKGGLKALLQKDFSGDACYRSQNPVMHLVEALLAVSGTLVSGPHLQQAKPWIDFLFNGVRSRQEPALAEFIKVGLAVADEPPRRSRLYRLRVLLAILTAHGSSVHPPFGWVLIPLREPIGSPEFKFASFHTCHGFKPRRTHNRLTKSPVIVLTSMHPNAVVIRI